MSVPCRGLGKKLVLKFFQGLIPMAVVHGVTENQT